MAKTTKKINTKDYIFSEEKIQSFLQTQQDFIKGKTTARDWEEIHQDLKHKFETDLPDN